MGSCRAVLWHQHENETISDAKFGFKADYSTVDAIFILQSLINNIFNSKKKCMRVSSV